MQALAKSDSLTVSDMVRAKVRVMVKVTVRVRVRLGFGLRLSKLGFRTLGFRLEHRMAK